jgi:hypothetical protein
MFLPYELAWTQSCTMLGPHQDKRRPVFTAEEVLDQVRMAETERKRGEIEKQSVSSPGGEGR